MKTPCEIEKQESKEPNLDLAKISEEKHEVVESPELKKKKEKKFTSVIEEKNESIDSRDQVKKKEKKNGFFQTSPFGSRKNSSKLQTNSSKEKNSEIILTANELYDKEQFELLRKTGTFELDLKHLADDPEVYGRTLAYCGDKFLRREKEMAYLLTSDVFTILQYLELKTLQLNMLQKQKINTLKYIVNLLNIQYFKESRSFIEHQKVLLEITDLIELIMRISPESCQLHIGKLNGEKWNTRKIPYEIIWESWNNLIAMWSDCLDVKQDLMTRLNQVKVLSDDVFKITKELEVFKNVRLPTLSQNVHVAYLITQNYLKTLLGAFFNPKITDDFIQEYMLHHTKTSDSEFVCVRDLFDYLHTKKINQATQHETRLVVIESLLSDVFKIPYNDFVEKLTSNAEHSQKFLL